MIPVRQPCCGFLLLYHHLTTEWISWMKREFSRNILFERMRGHAHDKLMNKLATARRKAKEKHAASEAKLVAFGHATPLSMPMCPWSHKNAATSPSMPARFIHVSSGHHAHENRPMHVIKVTTLHLFLEPCVAILFNINQGKGWWTCYPKWPSVCFWHEERGVVSCL